NPWQYRIFSTYLLEFFIRVFSKVSFLDNEYIPYFFLRFLQNVLIFYVAFKFYKSLEISSNYLIIIGILILGYNMSNSVFQSELSFNTYFDILFYLAAGYFVLNRHSYYIIPITILAAFNRETGILIPFMLLFTAIDFRERRIVNKKDITIALLSLLLFVMIFVGLRVHYGMPAALGIHGMSSPSDFFMFNITFFRMYPELFGTLGVIPLILIFQFGKLSRFLKFLFFLVVPIWFVVHFIKSTAVETRLFLVPQALVFIPACLQIIENEILKKG